MRLSNPNTRRETGLDYVLRNIDVITPYGQKRLKDINAFMPGNEEELKEELNLVESAMELLQGEAEVAEVLLETFMEVKDNSYTVNRSLNKVLTVVELYDIKVMLLQMRAIREMLEKTVALPDEFRLQDITELLDVLDPNKERINTFYIYDAFSEKLHNLRAEKRNLEKDIRKVKKQLKRKVETKYGLSLTPKYELIVSRVDKELMDKLSSIPELSLSDEDYMTLTYTLKTDKEIFEMQARIAVLNEAIEEEELLVRERLSKVIGSYNKILVKNCQVIGELDFQLAKAIYASKKNCVKPNITSKHMVSILDGRHLEVEDILQKKGKCFCPVTIQLTDGVTCITGANMGGKTVSLKMVGLIAMLAQYGFFVPCKEAIIGLSSYIHILVGDSQNVQRGLSSFGSEMEELKEILDNCRDRSLLLIDEIASGTNPLEGQALTKSLVLYLSEKQYISLITTHYENVGMDGKVKNLQVRGLADVNFNNLAREIRYANRRERIEIIGKYMDYRLYKVEKDEEIPKDAINIAQMLGINKEIIEQAKKYTEDRKNEE